MLEGVQKAVATRVERNSGLWPALAAALVLHAVILLIPITKQSGELSRMPAQIELQLTAFLPEEPLIPEERQNDDIPPVEPEGEILPVMTPEAEMPQIASEIAKLTEPPLPETPATETKQGLRDMPSEHDTRLTSAILSRQIIRQESEAEKIFGRPLLPDSMEPRKEFHYPLQPNMMTMLDRRLPELPFAYTPDLVYFAYDPGVKGDLQRFWDFITPEFGWRTNNGTEFKCKWVLVIAACGWK